MKLVVSPDKISRVRWKYSAAFWKMMEKMLDIFFLQSRLSFGRIRATKVSPFFFRLIRLDKSFVVGVDSTRRRGNASLDSSTDLLSC